MKFNKKEENFYNAYILFLTNFIKNNCISKLNDVILHLGKSNPDIFLQRFIKEEIVNNSLFSIEGYEDKIIEIITEDDEERRKEVKKEIIFWNNPDIVFGIRNSNGVYYEKLELKASKESTFKGSSIDSIDAEQQLIYFWMKKDGIQIESGIYGNAIIKTAAPSYSTARPRPKISINLLKENNEKNIKNNYFSKDEFLNNIVEKESNEIINKDINNFNDVNIHYLMLMRKVFEQYNKLSEDEKEKFLRDKMLIT